MKLLAALSGAVPASRRETVWLALTVVIALAIVLKPVLSHDLYWHLAYGREIARTGQIIDWDPFSYTHPGAHFDNRYWLAQWLFYQVWNAWGATGLLAIKLLTGALVSVFLFFTARHLGSSPGAAAITTLLAILASIHRFMERPELFSLLFFSLLGFLLVGYQAGRLRARWLGLIPVIMLVWDWLHGGVYGFGLLTAHVLIENLRCRFFPTPGAPSLKPLNLAYAVALGAMAANPWGLGTYGVFFDQLTQGRAQLDSIMEYRSVNVQRHQPFFFMLSWAALLTALRFRPRLAAAGGTSLALGFLGWRISRVAGVFALACGPYLAGLLAPRPGEPAWVGRIAKGSLILAALFVAGYGFWLKVAQPSAQQFGWHEEERYFPVGSVRFIKENGITGNLYNSGDIGGYLALELYPARPLFQYNHGQIFGDTGHYWSNPSEMERWGITYAIVRHSAELRNLFPVNEWARIYRDPANVLVVRRLPQYAELIEKFEIRYLFPGMPVQEYRDLARDPAALPQLARETAVYLAFRRDDRMAAELSRVLQANPRLALAPEIAPYLAKALRFNADTPEFAALVAAYPAKPIS